MPAQFEFMTVLPRSPLGKLLKRELRNKPLASGSASLAAADSHAALHAGHGNGDGSDAHGADGSNGKSGAGNDKHKHPKEAL